MGAGRVLLTIDFTSEQKSGTGVESLASSLSDLENEDAILREPRKLHSINIDKLKSNSH